MFGSLDIKMNLEPKAFIYFLVKFENLQGSITSLVSLAMYLNNKFQYPIVIVLFSDDIRDLLLDIFL